MQQNETKFSEIENPELVADIIGLSAVMVQDLAARRIKDYEFDWKRITSFEGDTGPYLQYSHARLCSMERKGLEQTIPITVNPLADPSLLVEKEGLELVNVISKYPSEVQKCFQTFEPCSMVKYLMTLSHSISSTLEKLRVVGSSKELAETRLFLYWCARIVLGNGLRLLGLTPLERM